MSLPTSRDRTYAPGSQVFSADLNDIQDCIIRQQEADHGPALLSGCCRIYDARELDGVTYHNVDPFLMHAVSDAARGRSRSCKVIGSGTQLRAHVSSTRRTS